MRLEGDCIPLPTLSSFRRVILILPDLLTGFAVSDLKLSSYFYILQASSDDRTFFIPPGLLIHGVVAHSVCTSVPSSAHTLLVPNALW